MKKPIGWVTVTILLVAIGVGLHLWQNTRIPEPVPHAVPAIEIPHAPVTQAVSVTHYPIPERANTQPASQPLPTLQESDHALLEALSGLLNQKTVMEFLYPEGVVRHIVATIDNLPRKRLSVQLLPVKPTGGRLLTKGEAQTLSIAPENAARYASYVRVAEMVDAKELVAVYVHFYPLFQLAYQDLGYPDGYFNDRLIVVIDHLLAAPEDREPARVIQPQVFYRFADQGLEDSSAGHKILIRIGTENAAKIKAKLRKIRQELTGRNIDQ